MVSPEVPGLHVGGTNVVLILNNFVVMQVEPGKESKKKSSVCGRSVCPRYPLSREGHDYVSILKLGRHRLLQNW